MNNSTLEPQNNICISKEKYTVRSDHKANIKIEQLHRYHIKQYIVIITMKKFYIPVLFSGGCGKVVNLLQPKCYKNYVPAQFCGYY